MPPDPTRSRPAFRVLPRVDEGNAHFWTGGAEGALRFLRCRACRHWIHPPAPICPACLSREVAPEAVSGRARVATFTINHQPWIPGFPPPYAIAIVELPEQAGLRLTTNLVGVAPEEIRIGMPVRVTFEERDGVWIPLFEPLQAPEGRAQPASERSERAARRSRAEVIGTEGERSHQDAGAPAILESRVRLEGQAAVTGVGQSRVGRRLGRGPMDLTIDACLAALADAGLDRRDVDGLATYPGGWFGPRGFSGPGIAELQDALRLELSWFTGGPEQPGQLGSVIEAVTAVACGLANHVLCFRTVWEATAQGGGGRAGLGMEGGGGGGFRAQGPLQWTLPFGAASAANWIALFAQRHFHEYGTTREQMAWVALNARRNAALNPNAVYRTPLTLDDYLSARMISTPFCLYDCDAPADGATAIVVSRADRARDLRKPPLRVAAVGSALRGRPSWDQFDDLTTMAMRDAGAMLWTRTELRPADVQVAELYDGFSFLAMAWLEALGLCGKGESGPFVAGGQRIALDGALPLNTHGGQLSAGRLHGYGFLHEAALQLWGEGGARQVPGPPRVGVAAAGGGPLAGCLLLVRD